MTDFRNNVALFLFEAGSKVSGKLNFSIVEDSHYTGIPSTHPDLYLLIEMPEKVLRILARVEYTTLTHPDDVSEIWLSAQACIDENTKYGAHLPVHGFFQINEPWKVTSLLSNT